MDTAHQGDQEKQKGVYHINTVDEVTQWEVIAAAEKINEEYLLPLLEKIITTYLFRIINFIRKDRWRRKDRKARGS
ncbi:MAG: hypothetical protein R6U52_05895 [Kosmotogaceae bacterium]